MVYLSKAWLTTTDYYKRNDIRFIEPYRLKADLRYLVLEDTRHWTKLGSQRLFVIQLLGLKPTVVKFWPPVLTIIPQYCQVGKYVKRRTQNADGTPYNGRILILDFED
jgi:hypothetical protein